MGGELSTSFPAPLPGTVVRARPWDEPRGLKKIVFKQYVMIGDSSDRRCYTAYPMDFRFIGPTALIYKHFLAYPTIHDLMAAVNVWAFDILQQFHTAVFMFDDDARERMQVNLVDDFDDCRSRAYAQRIESAYAQVYTKLGMRYHHDKQCYTLTENAYV